MEAGIDAGGEHITPYSKYVDQTKVPSGWKSDPASPATVTNVAMLPLGQSKRNIKSFLRERLFPPNHDIRTVLYKSLAKRIPCNKSMFSAQMYTDFIAESYPVVSLYTEAPLPSFISEDEDLPEYCLNDLGKLELRKILACINHHFPQISYCPILPPAVALFLHYDDSPSQVFTHVCHILFCNLRHAHYLDENKSEVQASSIVLRDLVQKFAASSHKTLVNLSSNPDEIYCQWLNVLFRGLPFSYLVILFDMYLLEGYKSLFRTAVALLKFYRKVGLSNPTDILSAVFDFVKSMDKKVSANLLFRKAFTLKLPTSKEIRKLHHKKMSIIRHQHSATDESKRTRNPWTYISMVRNVESDTVNENLLSTLYCWIPERFTLSRPTLLYSTNKDGYRMEAFFHAAFEKIPTILLIKTTENTVIGAFLTSDWSERKTDKKSYFGTGETFIFSLIPECKPYFWVGIGGTTKNGPLGVHSKSDMATASKVAPSSKGSVGKRNTRGVTLPPIHQESISPSFQSSTRDSRESSVILPPLIASPLTLESLPSRSSISIAETILEDEPQRNSSIEKIKTSNDLFMFSDNNGIIIGGGGGYGLFIDSSFLNCTTERCETFQNPPLVPGGSFQCSVVELFGFDSS